MCGIVAYIGYRQVIEILVKGLKRLEYRGYDSAGIGVLLDSLDKVKIVKKLGKVANLESASKCVTEKSTIGIAHTRWATHGAPSDRNSHPHDNQAGTIAIVHNGIIENYSSLKAILQKRGYVFKSDTDTEVLAHLIDDMMKTHDKCDLPQAVSLACSQVDGTFGIAVVSSKYPEMLIGARRGSPLIVGVSKGEYFLSSDASAIVDYTSDVIYLEDNDMIVMTRNGGHEIRSLEEEHKDEVLKRKIHHLEISRSEIEKGGHKFFMIKEILDQPRTLQNCMRGRVSIDCKSINLGGLSGEPLQRLLKARRIIVCACGTSWHAGIVGEYLLEHLAGVSVEVEYASEFRYKKPVLFKDEDVVLVISQSGETADTLAAVREAKRQGVPTLGIVNVVGSTIGRETDAGIYLHAGPEIGVASTKAFTGQVMVFSMLSILIGFKKGILNQKQYEDHVMALSQIPAQIAHILNNTSSVLEASKVYRYAQHMFFFGRGFNFPVALEGALKLKEISYIHAEGYAAAELKHGPIALIDASTPVVFVAPASDNAYEKIKANVLEASTQKAAIVVITEEDNKDFDDIAEFVFRIPRSKECFVPLLSVIPLQLLSYHIADMRGLDVDKPRNLAKSVTVE